MEAVLPFEVWGAVSSQTNGAACYYRQATHNLLRRQELGIDAGAAVEGEGSTQAGGGGAGEGGAAAAAGERAHFFCDMCALAWAEVAPNLSSISKPQPAGGEVVRDVFVGGPEPGGMGAPFGLSVDTSEGAL